MSPGVTNDSFQSSSGDFRILLDLVFKASDLQKANEIDQGTAWDPKERAWYIFFRSNPGPLQCWSWKDRNLSGGAQALARLPQPQCQGALHHAYHDCTQADEVPDLFPFFISIFHFEVPYDSKEGAVCLRSQVPQVKDSKWVFWSFFLAVSSSVLKRVTMSMKPKK